MEPLPHAPIRTVLGLLEHLREVPEGREDLYKLGGPMGFELDELLPVVEAAKRLGLVTVSAGDIQLTENGREIAAGEEGDRKRLIGGRLRGLPLIAEILRSLGEEGRVPRSEFVERLKAHFSPSEAERQVSTALDWGRYGEIFDLDPDTEEFFFTDQE
jgi:NitT/TauT family transport system ATP-binding protein